MMTDSPLISLSSLHTLTEMNISNGDCKEGDRYQHVPHVLHDLPPKSLKTPTTTNLVPVVITKWLIADPSLAFHSFELVQIACVFALELRLRTADRPPLVSAQ